MTKEEILDEIRKTTQENGGLALGRMRFTKETRISENQIHKHWRSFGEAQHAAGVTPNKLQVAYSDDFLLERLVLLTREVGRFPLTADLRMKKHADSSFPGTGAFGRLGNKGQVAEKLLNYAQQKGHDDIVELVRPIAKNHIRNAHTDEVVTDKVLNEVYLYKSGRYYKIGKTNDSVRRGAEIRIQLPEKLTLIHSIRTYDPAGIEAYWHKRFADKKMEGEWFNLSHSDVKTFIRWKGIFY